MELLLLFFIVPLLVVQCQEDNLITLEEMYRRIDSLDDQLKESESKIIVLQDKIQVLETLEHTREFNKNYFLTCDEIRAFDPSVSSGIYRIDPDGPNLGDDPISVYCDMAAGSTIISHDSEEPTRVNCTGRGCFNKQINYNVSMRQMVALSRRSRTCHQTFELQHDCRADDQLLVESSWWQDRYNVSRLFSHCIHKAEANSVCSIILCPEFNNSNLVPITGLNFGAAKQMNNVTENLEIRFTLGQLTCSGSVNEKRVEDSRIGGRSYPICPNDIGPDSKCFATLTGCYCINQVKRNWTDAAEFCRANGMRLVAIESEEEQNILTQLLISFDYNWWWTSGSDEVNEGQWKWSVSQPITYTNWGLNEPDGGAGENYIQMTRNWGFKWGDYSKTDQDFSICEL